MENNLANTKLAFIGCGVMAESIIAGLLRKKLVRADQIVATHPRENRRNELIEKYGIIVFDENPKAIENIRATQNSIVALCVKPQRLKGVLDELEDLVSPNQIVLSIIAGARIQTISEALNNKKIVRA